MSSFSLPSPGISGGSQRSSPDHRHFRLSASSRARAKRQGPVQRSPLPTERLNRLIASKRLLQQNLPTSTPAPQQLEPYSSTSSAINRNSRFIVSPSSLAVFKLTSSSNLVGCSTGRSAGFAPFSILSTYVAARRFRSARFAP